MNIGIIGAGNIGGTLANACGPETLADLARARKERIPDWTAA
jgi:predicted dinucleotide-binding enzyme